MFVTQSRWSRAIVALGLLSLLAACGGGGSGGIDASGSNGNGNGNGNGGGFGECVGFGELCESTIECCGGFACEPDGTGASRCSDTTACTGVGGDCAQASECCSLACDGEVCLGDAGLCQPEGGTCDADSDCCSNDCGGDSSCQSAGAGCSVLGERCGSEGFDDGCCSKNCENVGSESDPDLRCARASTCGARGDLCVAGSDCCSGVCGEDGRCPSQDQIGGPRFAGEPCTSDSDCASYACASRTPGGPQVCQFLGGCRPAGEICGADFQCCSDVELRDGSPFGFCTEEFPTDNACVAVAGVDGLSRCRLNEGDKEAGEICEDTAGNQVHNCCSGNRDDNGCEQTRIGVWRCAGGGDPGECIPDGDSCRTADQCCSGICTPNETDDGTVLICGPCVQEGNDCTTDLDCCEGLCNDGYCEGEQRECVPLGGECSEDIDCCSGICGDDGYCGTIIIE